MRSTGVIGGFGFGMIAWDIYFVVFFFFGGVVNIVDICGFVVRLVVLAWEENGSKRTSEKKPADTCGVY